MAKRAAASKDGVNVSAEIRALVESNKDIRGPEVITALKEKFPGAKFNNASVQVAFANARKKLGLTRTLKKKPRPVGSGSGRRPGRPAAAAPAAPAAVAAAAGVDFSLLQAAKTLLQHCKGDVAAAQQALKQLAALQMG
ncbi:MAG: hypothetical protein JNM43_00185 [Planctomycetaceae bacterium]|nr:hypothetical protein [Planctomycetaceae bacterium]